MLASRSFILFNEELLSNDKSKPRCGDNILLQSADRGLHTPYVTINQITQEHVIHNQK